MTERKGKLMAAKEQTRLTKRWITVGELAEYLGLSARTIYNRVSPKSKSPFPIKPKRFGRHVLFDIQEVDKLLEKL